MDLKELLDRIIPDSLLHARWLNTLSYLENQGARMIAQAEHPTLVQEEMLKHAAEEFRHAHFLKRQISKKLGVELPTYQLLLGNRATLHYLPKLNLATCRLLKRNNLPLLPAAYWLVTYAIELRAKELYPAYQKALKKHHCPISMMPLILEEEEHLALMQAHLEEHFDPILVDSVLTIENGLFQNWINALQ